MTLRLKTLVATGATLMLTTAMTQVAMADTIRFWTTEEQPDRVAAQEKVAADFAAETGHSVQIIPVSEKDLGVRATAAFAAGDLPDVIYHPMQFLLPWTEAGILDPGAATEVVEALGPETFAEGPLNFALFDDEYLSVPSDGWTQMIVYRQDLFDAAGLEPPTSFAAIEAAVEALHNPPETYGFVAPTKIDETYMMQVIEHISLANGYSPVNADGSINEDTAPLKEVIAFYETLVDASPQGELFWKQAREQYFAGKAAMIIWSPFILDELAGLRDSDPPTINDDPQSRELAGKTGFVTSFQGPSSAVGSAWADARYFGITNDANTDVAIQFVEYAMTVGYGDLLAMAPEGKFPIRKGDDSDPVKFEALWSTLPVGVDREAPLSDIYPQAVIDDIVAGLVFGDRWGARTGQLETASKIANARIMAQVVRRYVDGELSLDEAADEIVAQHKAL